MSCVRRYNTIFDSHTRSHDPHTPRWLEGGLALRPPLWLSGSLLARLVGRREFLHAGLDPPDLARVLRDGTVAGELAGRGDVHDGLSGPGLLVLKHQPPYRSLPDTILLVDR